MMISTTTGKRAIDDLPPENPRPQQMQVLALGLSRTGTMSLQLALQKLGYKVYHFTEVGQRGMPDSSHVPLWKEAFDAKLYGTSKPYGKEEFDRLLRNYSATTDAPCCCFSDELIAAYPEAKVILNTRDRQKWLASMETSYYALLESKKFRFFRAICALDWDVLRHLHELLQKPLLYWTNFDWQNRSKLADAFDEHNEHIREIVPEGNLLEWQPGDGWEPICKFLKKEVPNEPFPHINKGDSVQNLFVMIGRIRLATLIFNAMKWPVGISSAVAFAAWWAWKMLQWTQAG